MIQALVLTVKRRETPLADLAYRAAKRLLTLELPAPRILFLPVWYLHHFVLECWRWVSRCLYYQPMFRARCERVGKALRIDNGVPYVYGNLRIRVGDHCLINAVTSLVATKVGEDPTLEIGDHSYVGCRVSISVGRRVSIGSHVLIANDVNIADNPGHPMDPLRRRAHGVDPDQVKPVTIEDDVWIGGGARIMPGVTIGRGSVIGAGSIVTKDVPPFSLAAGAPAKVIRELPRSLP